MTVDRLLGYLEEIELAAREVEIFLRGMTYQDFAQNIVTQRAIGMNLLMIGEASVRLAEEFPEFVLDHPDIPSVKIQGMRNRIAHGYRSINLDTIWDTVQTAIPDLLDKLETLRNFHAQGE
jgi:uncharacterized protein with HEPN domain